MKKPTKQQINIAATEFALLILGKEQFKSNLDAKKSIKEDFKAGANFVINYKGKNDE